MDRGEGGGGIVNRIASMLMEHIDQQISAQVSPIKDKLEKIEQKIDGGGDNGGIETVAAAKKSTLQELRAVAEQPSAAQLENQLHELGSSSLSSSLSSQSPISLVVTSSSQSVTAAVVALSATVQNLTVSSNASPSSALKYRYDAGLPIQAFQVSSSTSSSSGAAAAVSQNSSAVQQQQQSQRFSSSRYSSINEKVYELFIKQSDRTWKRVGQRYQYCVRISTGWRNYQLAQSVKEISALKDHIIAEMIERGNIGAVDGAETVKRLVKNGATDWNPKVHKMDTTVEGQIHKFNTIFYISGVNLTAMMHFYLLLHGVATRGGGLWFRGRRLTVSIPLEMWRIV